MVRCLKSLTCQLKVFYSSKGNALIVFLDMYHSKTGIRQIYSVCTRYKYHMSNSVGHAPSQLNKTRLINPRSFQHWRQSTTDTYLQNQYKVLMWVILTTNVFTSLLRTNNLLWIESHPNTPTVHYYSLCSMLHLPVSWCVRVLGFNTAGNAFDER